MTITTETYGTFDPYCERTADQIPEVVTFAMLEGVTPDAFAREDGTFNPAEGTFACTECYLALGAPSTPFGWTAKGRS